MLKAADSIKDNLSSERTQPQGPKAIRGPSRHKSLTNLTLIYSGGNIAATILRTAGGILTAKIVEPAVLGLFNGMGLVLGYAPFLQLGILQGLSRELPFYMGKGDAKLARSLAAAAQAWALFVGGLVALGLLGVAGWQIWEGKYSLAFGWVSYAFSAIVFFYGWHYLVITYRTSHDFARLAVIHVAHNFVGLILVVLVWLLTFYGLCLRLIAMGFIFLSLLYFWRPLNVAPCWDRKSLWHLLKVGAPIFGVGQLYVWWTVLDSTLVLHFLGVEGLGLYSLALMVKPALQLLPESLASICYPRMAEEYGRNGRLANLFGIVVKPMFWCILVMIPLVLSSWFILPPLAKFFLPKYSYGVPAAQWALVSAGLMPLAAVYNVFNVIKKQEFYFVAVILGMGTYVGCLLWLIRSEVYLEAFPQAMLAGSGIYHLFCWLLLFRLSQRETN